MINLSFKKSCAACLALLVVATPASAETNPYYFGGAQAFNQISNVFRQAFAPSNDTLASTSLLAGLDQKIGRQRLFVDGSLQSNRYRSNTALNNQGYSLKAGLDWATLERLSGAVDVNASNALADYNVGSNLIPIFKRNIERNRQYHGLFRLGLVTRYSLEANLMRRERNFSAAEYAQLESRQDSASLGLSYKPSAALALGVAARHTSGVFPNYPLLFAGILVGSAEDKYQRDDIDLTTELTASGASKVAARLSRGKSSHSLSYERNFSGITGVINWTWQPSAKLNLSTQLLHDTGQEILVAGVNQNRIVSALQVTANYDLTGKVMLNAGANISHGDYTYPNINTLNFDNVTSVNLGARWVYSRGMTFGCQGKHNSRSNSTPQYGYSAGSLGCYAQGLLY
jgi:hypothetical protein